MAYHIHWRFTEDSPRAHTSEPILTREAALAQACLLAKWDAFALWIEGPNGERIETEEILQYCLDRRSRNDSQVA